MLTFASETTTQTKPNPKQNTMTLAYYNANLEMLISMLAEVEKNIKNIESYEGLMEFKAEKIQMARRLKENILGSIKRLDNEFNK